MRLLERLLGGRPRTPSCYVCAEQGHVREMTLVQGGVTIDMGRWDKPWSPTQGCFQCTSCGRLTCWTHSEKTTICECGACEWASRTYLQKEIDNG